MPSPICGGFAYTRSRLYFSTKYVRVRAMNAQGRRNGIPPQYTSVTHMVFSAAGQRVES
jgi:hypothetical protein